MREQDKRRPQGAVGFAVLLILYIAAAVIMPRVSRSGGMLVIGQYQLPIFFMPHNLFVICIITALS